MRIQCRLPGIIAALCLSGLSYAQPLSNQPEIPKLDNALIKAAGTDPIYLIHGGRKYKIPTPAWIAAHGYNWKEVRVLDPALVDALPAGYELTESSALPGSPEEFEDRLVASPDGRIYLVKKGRRRWILDGRWIAESRYAGQPVMRLSDADVQAIDPGLDITYTTTGNKVANCILIAALFSCLFIASGRTELVIRIRDSIARWPALKLLYNRWTLLGVFIVAVCLRAPFLLTHPRFWAEEGTSWFQFAASHPVSQMLFYARGSGYLNLLSNLAAILSSLVSSRMSLHYAPAVTTLIALLVQLSAIAMILFGRSLLFDSLWKAAAGCVIVLFVPTATPEIWLNTTNSMSYLGLITTILLFQGAASPARWVRWVLRGLVVLCGLSSPYSVALTPLFIWSAWHDNHREKKIHSLLLICCCMVEAGFVIWSRLTGVTTLAMRGTEVFWDISMVNIFCGQIVLPCFGFVQQKILELMGLDSAWIASSSFPHPHNADLVLAGWVCAALIGLILWLLTRKPLYSINNLLAAVFAVFAAFTSLTSLHGIPLGRYAFLPGLAFLLLLFVNADFSRRRITPYICALFLSCGLASGMLTYRENPDPGEPDWASEVRMWSADHTHKLRIWPSFWQETITYEPPKR